MPRTYPSLLALAVALQIGTWCGALSAPALELESAEDSAFRNDSRWLLTRDSQERIRNLAILCASGSDDSERLQLELAGQFRREAGYRVSVQCLDGFSPRHFRVLVESQHPVGQFVLMLRHTFSLDASRQGFVLAPVDHLSWWVLPKHVYEPARSAAVGRIQSKLSLPQLREAFLSAGARCLALRNPLLNDLEESLEREGVALTRDAHCGGNGRQGGVAVSFDARVGDGITAADCMVWVRMRKSSTWSGLHIFEESVDCLLTHARPKE
jgi:hypothetical protein